MGETKNGMSKQNIGSRGDAQRPGRIAESRIDELVWERKLEEKMHEHDICRNSHRQYVKGWEDVIRVS